MAVKRIVDYYAVLNVPPTADLAGIENAYTRLSDELANQMSDDPTASIALKRLNEAYGVLSHPDQRIDYDRVYFSKEIADYQAQQRHARRRQMLASSVIVGALSLIVVLQGVVLAFMGREYVTNAAEVLLGPLFPGGAG